MNAPHLPGAVLERELGALAQRGYRRLCRTKYEAKPRIGGQLELSP